MKFSRYPYCRGVADLEQGQGKVSNKVYFLVERTLLDTMILLISGALLILVLCSLITTITHLFALGFRLIVGLHHQREAELIIF